MNNIVLCKLDERKITILFHCVNASPKVISACLKAQQMHLL